MTVTYLELRAQLRPDEIDGFHEAAEGLGVLSSRFPQPHDRVVAVEGPADALASLGSHPAVRGHLALDPRFPLVSRGRVPEGRHVQVGDLEFGGESFVLAAGPCSVEDAEQIGTIASALRGLGVRGLRGGVHKPRTSPHDFQGLGEEGLHLLRHVAQRHRMAVITEVLDASQISGMLPHVDMFQVGARNMQNFTLLRALAEQPKPVLLKRGPGATWKEWLLAAEHLVIRGQEQVVLCERGIRTFEDATRFTLDLASAVLAKQRTWCPVVVDPSHGTGVPSLIPAMSLAALAAGLDGVLVEVHHQPEHALSDGAQALRPEEFAALVRALRAAAPTFGRVIPAGEEEP